MGKRRYFHMTRETKKNCNIHFLHHQPYQLGYGKGCHIFCKRLVAMLSEKRDSHTAKWEGGLVCCYLSFALLRASVYVYQICKHAWKCSSVWAHWSSVRTSKHERCSHTESPITRRHQFPDCAILKTAIAAQYKYSLWNLINAQTAYFLLNK